MFAQRFLGFPLGKHFNSLEKNAWRKVISTSKKTVSMTDHRFFVVVLSELGVGYIDTRIAQGFVQTVVKYVVKSND